MICVRARNYALCLWDRCKRSSRIDGNVAWIKGTSIIIRHHGLNGTVHRNVLVVLHKNVSNPLVKHVIRLCILNMGRICKVDVANSTRASWSLTR